MAVGHPDGGDAEERRGGEQLLGMGGAAQEGEVGGDLQLGIASPPRSSEDALDEPALRACAGVEAIA